MRETDLKVHPNYLKQDVSMIEKMLKPDYINNFPVTNEHVRYVWLNKFTLNEVN